MMCVGIAEEPNFLEQFRAEEMSLIDEKNCCAFLLLGFQQHLVKGTQALWLARRTAVDLEFFQHHLKKLIASERGVKNECGPHDHLLPRNIRKHMEGGVEEGSLPGADGAGNRHKSLAVEDALEQNGQSCLVRGGEVHVSRIRCQTKRLVVQTVEG